MLMELTESALTSLVVVLLFDAVISSRKESEGEGYFCNRYNMKKYILFSLTGCFMTENFENYLYE